MKQLLKGGTVVSGSGAQRADVLVEGEKILEVAPDITCPAAKTVDCAGMLLFPGFIDAHTHFDLDVCNTTTADDFHSGKKRQETQFPLETYDPRCGSLPEVRRTPFAP